MEYMGKGPRDCLDSMLWMAIIAVFQIAGLFISIVGIPVAIVMAKSIGVYINPVGKTCVPSLLKEEIERAKIRKEYKID